jgi:2'-5' RNA ligase
VRLFVAFEIPPELRLEISRRSLSSRDELPPARWLGAAAMHLTLVFLGEVGEDRLGALGRAGAAALAGEAPIRLRIGEAGSFPPGRPVRVVWLAVESDRDLGPLQGRLSAACGAAAGVEPDGKPYHPHLTLARCAPPWPLAACQRLSSVFAGGVGEPFEAGEAVLFRSHLGGGPARHEAIQRWPLEARG